MIDKCYGEKLSALSFATAVKLAEGRSTDDIAILGAFFTVLGDQLSLFAATKTKFENSCSEK